MPLLRADISHAWVTELCRELAQAPVQGQDLKACDVRVRSCELVPLASDQGVISRYQSSTNSVLVGHHVLTLHAVVAGVERRHRLVIKAKPPGATTRRRMAEAYDRIDRRAGSRLVAAQRRVSPSILDDCHTRELHVYSLDRPSLRALTPAIARVWLDPQAQIFAVVMELLEGVRHAHTLHDLDAWLPADLDCALSQIARLHGDFLGQLDPAAPPPWLVPFAQLHHPHLLAYQAELLRYNADTFPELFSAARVRTLETLLASAPARQRAIAARPLTLIHGDFTPRNLCLRTAERGEPGGLRLCAYDWELAQLHLPQRDVCELLCYALSPQRGWRDDGTAQLLARYRAALTSSSSAVAITDDDFTHDLALALAELATFKLLVQGITHQLLPSARGQRGYFERLVHNVFDGLAAFPTPTYQERAS